MTNGGCWLAYGSSVICGCTVVSERIVEPICERRLAKRTERPSWSIGPSFRHKTAPELDRRVEEKGTQDRDDFIDQTLVSVACRLTSTARKLPKQYTLHVCSEHECMNNQAMGVIP